MLHNPNNQYPQSHIPPPFNHQEYPADQQGQGGPSYSCYPKNNFVDLTLPSPHHHHHHPPGVPFQCHATTGATTTNHNLSTAGNITLLPSIAPDYPNYTQFNQQQRSNHHTNIDTVPSDSQGWSTNNHVYTQPQQQPQPQQQSRFLNLPDFKPWPSTEASSHQVVCDNNNFLPPTPSLLPPREPSTTTTPYTQSSFSAPLHHPPVTTTTKHANPRPRSSRSSNKKPSILPPRLGFSTLEDNSTSSSSYISLLPPVDDTLPRNHHHHQQQQHQQQHQQQQHHHHHHPTHTKQPKQQQKHKQHPTRYDHQQQQSQNSFPSSKSSLIDELYQKNGGNHSPPPDERHSFTKKGLDFSVPTNYSPSRTNDGTQNNHGKWRQDWKAFSNSGSTSSVKRQQEKKRLSSDDDPPLCERIASNFGVVSTRTIDGSTTNNNDRWDEWTPLSNIGSTPSAKEQEKRLSDDPPLCGRIASNFGIVSTTPSAKQQEQQVLADNSPVYERIASNFKGYGTWTNAPPDTTTNTKRNEPTTNFSRTKGVNGSNTIGTPKKGFSFWEETPRLSIREETSMNYSKKQPIRQSNWSAPPIPPKTKGNSKKKTKETTEVSKIASALSQLSNLKKRWNPPLSKHGKKTKRDRNNSRKMLKRKNQQEQRKQNTRGDENKKQRFDDRTVNSSEKLEKDVSTIISCAGKDQDVSALAVMETNPAPQDHTGLNNRLSDEDEEMDISDDEEVDEINEKYLSPNLKTFSTKDSHKEGEISQISMENKRHILHSAGGDRIGLSPTTTILDSGIKFSVNEHNQKDLTDELTVHTPKVSSVKQLTKTNGQKEIIGLQTNQNFHELPNLQKTLAFKHQGENFNNQVKDRVKDGSDAKKRHGIEPTRPFIKNLNEEDKINLYNELYSDLPEAKATHKTPTDVSVKHENKLIKNVEGKGKCFDSSALSVTGENRACDSKSIPESSGNEELKSDIPSTPTLSTSSESLAFKKARLAIELNKIKIEKAKAQLRMAQIKKRDALREKINRGVKKLDFYVPPTPGSSEILSKDKAQENVTAPSVRKLSPFNTKTVASVERKRIADVTAFSMPTLIISDITESGAPEKVRIIPPEGNLGSDHERNVIDNQTSNEGLRTPTSTKTESLSVATNAIAKSGTSTSLSSEGLTCRKKLDLKLKKIRLQLQVKILEKAKAQKDRCSELSKRRNISPNHENANVCVENDNSKVHDSIVIENEQYNLEKPLVEKKDAIKPLGAKQWPNPLSVGLGGNTKNQEKTRKEACADINNDPQESSKNSTSLVQVEEKKATMDPRTKVLRREEVMKKLLERQTILKENINASREVNKELKYEKGVSDLAHLVERQRKMMKYHGDKINESKSSLLKCSEQLIEEKKQMIASEKNLESFLKRKKVMESMVLSTTTKLIDCRRKRVEILKRIGEKKAE